MAWIAAIISGVVGLASASKQKDAAKDAAAQQAAQQQAAAGNLSQGYNQAMQGLGQYTNLGAQAAYGLGELTGQKGYRTAEEQAYTDFINKGPPTLEETTMGPGGTTTYGDFLKKNPFVKKLGPEKAGVLGAIGMGLPPQIGKSLGGHAKRKAAHEARVAAEANARAQKEYEDAKAAAEAKHQTDLAAWNTQKAEMEQAVATSLETYDPMKVLQSTPGYMARYQQGQAGVENMQAGRALGGRALKEMQKYGQDYASNEYGNEFNRRLQMATMGQNAATTVGNMAIGQGTALAGVNTNLGNIAAQQGQAQSAYYNDINNLIQGGLGSYADYQAKQNAAVNNQPQYSSAYNYNIPRTDYTPGQTLGQEAMG